MTSAPSLRQFQLALVIALGGLSVWAAIAPVSRTDWFIENLFVWIAAVVIISLRNRILLSRVASVLIAIFLAMQISASHFAYQPPIGAWVGALFGSERNAFDRFMHLAFGLLLFVPMVEFLEATFRLARPSALVFSIVWLTAFGAVYEIIEWSSVMALDSESAAVFVGLQGDPWDPQKDMALALLGSVVAYVHVRLWRRFVTERRVH